MVLEIFDQKLLILIFLKKIGIIIIEKTKRRIYSMTVIVRITLTKDEVEEYRKCWKECNPGDISDEEIKDDFLEWFWADKHKYLCSADINCDILEG